METGFQNDFIPPMTTITSGAGESLAADIFYLPVQIVNVYLIGDSNQDKDWVLIDAGMPGSADTIIGTREKRFGPKSRPRAIILTHGHFDHVGALVELADHWDVPIYAHELELPYLTGTSDYPPGDQSVGGGLVSQLSPMFPNHAINLGNRVEQLPSDGNLPFMPAWRWIHTPGHTPGHISLFRDKDRTLIVGDAFLTVKQESLYKVITQVQEISGPPKYFTTDWQKAEESVKQLAALKPMLALTGHGRPMFGETLQHELERLAKDFKEIAVPEQGRFV